MKKHNNYIIASVVVLAVLAGAWFFGGNYNLSESSAPTVLAQNEESSSPFSDSGVTGDSTLASSESVTPANGESTIDAPLEPPATPSLESSGPAEAALTDPFASNQAAELTEGPTERPSSDPATESKELSITDPTQDEYKTDPVPQGNPLPVEPQDVTVGDGSFTVTLSVRCDTISNNMNLLSKEKYELVPADGVIFPAAVVTAYEGESVFNVFQREMRRARIHMAFRNTPIYNSAYIEAVNNLYEFDVGELSGWKYKVNGWFPNYGSSRYQLKPGDVIEWLYTCDSGRDLGEYMPVSGQLDE